MFDDSLSLLFCLFTLCCPERERVLLGGSRLPSEQLKSLLLLLPLPPPPAPPTDDFPLGFLKKDSRAHMCMPGCAQKIQTHTGLRLCF